MNQYTRNIIGLLGIASLSAGLYMLSTGKDWEAPMLWLCIGAFLLIEYRDQQIEEPPNEQTLPLTPLSHHSNAPAVRELE